MKNYLDLLARIMCVEHWRDNRTGIVTKSLFHQTLSFDLRNGFPLVTTKKIYLKGVVHELLWFLKGDTNIKYLKDNGVAIWDEWADANGELGPIYGYQWRNWGGTGLDQIKNSLELLRRDPYSRRNVVSAWNASDVPKMALAPCHTMFQITADKVDGVMYVDLCMFQRSADYALGVPFNIASYALLLTMYAKLTGYTARKLSIVFGDCHIYQTHLDPLKEQLLRVPKKLPSLVLNVDKNYQSFEDFEYEDFVFVNYNPHPPIKMEVAV